MQCSPTRIACSATGWPGARVRDRGEGEHLLWGDGLEQSGAADAIVLAEHFRRGAEASRAARWYERAAAQSLSANDLVAAIERAELGLAGGASGEQAGKLRLIAAEAHVWRGELAEAERRALAAADDLPSGGSA